MSSKHGKGDSGEKESPRPQVKAAVARPAGRAPVAMVVARHGQATVTRSGKGFSLGELAEASVVPRMAWKWGAKLDRRRRSVVQTNVTSLKAWGSHAVKAERPAGVVKKVEEEVVKVEKKVKKSAAEVRKEIVKIEAKAKRETTRAAGKVKKKTQKPPKARRKKKK
ncbi:MAG TPA: ribosomal protein L13e [Nitrososphaerales archaeon]|nr:ribosomal protein L13e [Nitrososphaerales archaeon]